jgi:bifunctional non-homologous end joining protein LigD
VTLARIEPMKAVLGDLPLNDSGWAFETKWDGMRILADLDGRSLRLRSVLDNDVSGAFPELAGLQTAFGGRAAVLDGEVIAFDEDGAPSFSELAQHRMQIRDSATAVQRMAETPVAYMVFDLLHFDGHDSWRLPYLDRRRLLNDLLDPGDHWIVPTHHIGGGAELLARATSDGTEGLVAKRVDRPYEPGRRSSSWRKIKVRQRQEFVVGGWLPGSGNRAGHLASLILGCHQAPGRLGWVGNVGTGFGFEELRRLTGEMSRLASDHCPFVVRPEGPRLRSAHWVRPEMVVECEFAAWTADGKMRHSSYLGERTDKAAADVTCEP